MPKALSIKVGDRFTTHTVTGPAPARSGHLYWRLVCTCGKVREVRASRLEAGPFRCSHPLTQSPVNVVDTIDTAELSMLKQRVEALEQALAKLLPPKPRLTVNSVNGNTMNSAERVKNQLASVAIAETLAAKAGRTPEETEELRDRLRIEMEVCQTDLDPERALDRAARAAVLIRNLK